jgi:uncharacterized DUF497 family protein
LDGFFHWGPDNKERIREITRARMVIIGPDNREQYAYVMFVVTAPNRIEVISEPQLSWVEVWKARDH